jgi:hypothetical protein
MFVCVAGTMLAAGTLLAQDTTRRSRHSVRHVQVSKGEVALPRVDTVYATRFDTVYVSRVDSVYFPGRRVVHMPYAVVRTDTFRVVVGPTPFVRTPLYAALYTGMTAPAGDIDRLYTNGFHAGMMVGWDATQEPVGIRLRGDVAVLSREAGALPSMVGTTTPTIATFGADVKLFPLMLTGWRIYGVGGAMVSGYKGIATVSERGRGMMNMDGSGPYRPVSGSDWVMRFGWNAGGGADIQFGPQELFLEARAVALRSDAAWTWLVPISLGIRFF